MRPISLTFAGLRSYRDEITIDFSDLDLFAIIGDTGAGKSTIIEALSLALYARKTWSGGARLEELIADGERALRVELTFAAGGHEWTVTRSRYRNANPGVNRLVCLTGPERVDGADAVTARVTELLGLDHGQFTRAVVLPQGRFDELLRSTPATRGKLLGSILGLDEVRRVGAEADRLARQWKPVAQRARDRRLDLPADPGAALRAAEGEAERTARRRDELASAARAVASHADELAAAERQAERLRPALAAVPAEGPWLDELERVRGLAERLLAERAEAVQGVEAAAARAEEVDAEVAAALDGFAGRDQAVVAAARLRTAAAELEKARADLDAARARRDEVAAAAPATTVDPSLAAAATAAEQARVAAAAHRDAVRQAVAEHRRARQEEAAAAARVARGRAALGAAEATVAGAAAAAEAAATELRSAEEALARADAARRQAMAAHAAAAAAAGCRPGDPCPVCRRQLPDGFVAPAGAGLDQAEAEHTAATAAARAARAATDRSLLELDAARSARASAAAELADAQTAEAAAADRVEATATPGGADEAEADADHRLAAAEAAATGARDRLTTAEAETRSRVEAHGRELDAAGRAVVEAEDRAAALSRSGDDLPPAWRPLPVGPGGVGPADLLAAAERVGALVAGLDRLEERRRACEADRSSAEAAVERVERRAAEEVTAPATRSVAAVEGRVERVRAVADVLGVAGPAPVPHEVRAARLAGTIDAVRAASVRSTEVLAAAAEALARIEARCEAAAAALADALAQAGFSDAAALHQAAGAERERAASAERAARAAAADVEVAAALDRVLEVAEPFVADLEVLAVAMRDQHFLGHLMKAREAELLAEATRRLRSITGGRFGFVGDFGVVSLGSGEVRSPDTLSGGERFQAALALALALVEIASRGGGRLDAVFVDEGFGSLDASALDTALDTLGTVAGGGKLVALISHLRPVAEYVDTVLHVTKDEVLGSRVARLDPDQRDRLLADDARSGLTA